jgi:hypothetical protein
MTITGINIEWLAVNEAPRQREPFMGQSLVALDDSGKSLIASRIVSAISLGGHCVTVVPRNDSANSVFDMTTSMLDVNEDDFISISHRLTKKLNDEQRKVATKDGVAIFMRGNCLLDEEQVRFISIIKAEPDKGLHKTVRGDSINLQVIDNMFLGHSQRLLKMSFFIEENKPNTISRPRSKDDFSVRVYDHTMQNSSNGEAARYFYHSFLDCDLPEDAPRLTAKFYESISEIIRGIETESFGIELADKIAYKHQLTAYMQNQETMINPVEFARICFPESLRAYFINKCREENLINSFSKDISLIQRKLNKQSIKIRSKDHYGVLIVASAEDMRKYVDVGKTDNEGWTNLRILGNVEQY